MGSSRIAAAALLVVVGAAVARAQEDAEKAGERARIDQARRDQEYARDQIRSLRDRMTSLAAKFEKDGEKEKADLLRQAVKMVDEKKIEDLMQSVLEEIKRDRSNEGAQKAEEARQAVADILALLEQRGRDRQTEERLRQIEESRKSVDRILEEQKRIRSETEKARKDAEESSQPAYAEGRKEIEALQKDLDRVDEEVRSAAAKAAEAEARAAGLEALRKEQEEVAAAMEKEAAEAPKDLAAALDRMRALAADADRAAADAGRKAPVPGSHHERNARRSRARGKARLIAGRRRRLGRDPLRGARRGDHARRHQQHAARDGPPSCAKPRY